MIYKDPKQVLVSHCLQFLLILVLYPIPEDGRGSSARNYFRHFLGRLHRLQDFQFLVDGMIRTLNQPVDFPPYSIANLLMFQDASYLFLPTGQSKGGQMGSRDDHAFLGNLTVQQEVPIVCHR